eukprot:2616097-Karenia_brevis.AAC.1
MQHLNSSTRQRCMSKSLHLSSLIRQWIPISKFVTISAITIRDDSNEDGQELITDTEAVLLQLARYWTPFLDGTASSIDVELASRLLENLPLPDAWDWSKIQFPSLSRFKHTLKLMHDNSPGFDGLPYSALSTLSDTAVALMYKQFYQLCTFNSSRPLNLHGFNTIVQSNVPKKLTTPHGQGVAVAIDETRSLSCKNTDNKIVCKCMAQVLMYIIMHAANASQKGFISGRHFTDNILSIDTVMRVYSNLYRKYGKSVAAFFDFCNAFPSVAIQWIFLVLRWLKLPQGVINFIHAIYHDVDCFIKHAGCMRYMCSVRSGVLQGCPLASELFLFSIEPFCILLNNTVHNQGIVELCADDIAIVLQSWLQLHAVHIIFQYAERCAGLKLKLRKCFLIPLAAPLSAHTIEIMRDYIRTRIPDWISFRITSSAEYLGIFLGPDAGCQYWSNQLCKYYQRLNIVGKSGVATSLAVKAYNLKVVPVLSYPLQMLPPPPNINKIEKYAFCKLYKTPYNSVSHSQQFTFSQFGLDQMNSISALHTAVQARFYKSSQQHVDNCTKDLFNSVDSLKLSELPRLTRSFWDNEPIVSNITRGRRGEFLPGHEEDSELA